MKLYTEEQVLNMLRSFHTLEMNVQLCMLKLTPIELPSDEKIDYISYTNNPYPIQKQMHIDWSNGFERGAKWVIEQIKNK